MRSQFSNFACALSYWVVVALAGCGSGSGTSSSIPCATGAVDVVGLSNQLIRDGKQWIPQGFYQIDFEVPVAELPNHQQFWSTGQQNDTSDEDSEKKQFGADSVRIPVAQTGTDFDNATFYSSTFHDEVLGAIKAPRTAGLTVIASVQDEQRTGDLAQNTALPSDRTQQVGQAIAPVFASDRGVLIELFNELHIGMRVTVPFLPADSPTGAVAMNRTIQTIRPSGVQTVVVADGLQFAQELTAAPVLNDPLHQVTYAALPYSEVSGDQASTVWDEKFGAFAATQPVIISGWGIGYFCDSNTRQRQV